MSKPKPIKVKCMDCRDFDVYDMYCIAKHKDIPDPYHEVRCRGFVRIKS
jgi:hypothetical protein